MKPVQTKFGQALQLAGARQQVTGLQQQVEKLKGDIKELRDMDRKIFDEQEKQISALKAVAHELLHALEDCWHGELTVASAQALEKRVKQLLGEEQ